MKKLRIKLSTPKDVEEFVNIASKYDYDIDLRSGVVYIDAKSFLGVMTMGLEKELDAHSVAIAELMAEHEHGILETTSDKILIDFVTKSRSGVDRKKLQSAYPEVYDEVKTVSKSRSLKVSSETK